MADKIEKAYHDSKNIYDEVLTQKSWWGRLYIKLFWSGTDDNEIAKKVLDYIPNDFSGTILDVPVGTAVFTENKWKKLHNAIILCVDYSKDMLEQAESRLNSPNINCMQGDVGNLPMQNESFQIVCCMNGFHAFSDKESAFSEIWRVLKKGGSFIGCFYVKGESKITDWLVDKILSKKGWFTPPFLSKDELLEYLKKQYKEIDIHLDGSIIYFRCVK